MKILVMATGLEDCKEILKIIRLLEVPMLEIIKHEDKKGDYEYLRQTKAEVLSQLNKPNNYQDVEILKVSKIRAITDLEKKKKNDRRRVEKNKHKFIASTAGKNTIARKRKV